MVHGEWWENDKMIPYILAELEIRLGGGGQSQTSWEMQQETLMNSYFAQLFSASLMSLDGGTSHLFKARTASPHLARLEVESKLLATQIGEKLLGGVSKSSIIFLYL